MASNKPNQSEGGAALLDQPEGDDPKMAALQAKIDQAVNTLLQMQGKVDEQAGLIQKLAAMASGKETPQGEPAVLQLVNTSVNVQKALEALADTWPKSAHRPGPTRIITRTYRVQPLIAGKAIAEIANCLDESDAKSFYARALNKNEAIPCRVTAISQQSHTAPADPASAAADAA